MGRLHRNTSISTAPSARPVSTAGPTAPSLTFNRSTFTKKLIVRTTGLLAILSLVGISYAADSVDKSNAPNAPKNSNNTSMNLSANESATIDDDASGAADQTTETTVSGSQNATNDSSSSYNVTVNGQSIDVPENGTNQETITTPDSTTTVTVDNSSTSTGSSFSSNSTTTRVQSNGKHDVRIEHNFDSP